MRKSFANGAEPVPGVTPGCESESRGVEGTRGYSGPPPPAPAHSPDSQGSPRVPTCPPFLLWSFQHVPLLTPAASRTPGQHSVLIPTRNDVSYFV